MTRMMAVLLAGAVLMFLSVVNTSAMDLLSLLERSNPKFSVELGGGRAFHLNAKEGALNGYTNSSVFTARIGYSPIKYVEVQGEYLNPGKFEQYRETPTSQMRTDFKFTAYALNLKFMAPMHIRGVALAPYITTGLGRIRGNFTTQSSWVSGTYQGESSGSGNIAKLGGGLDVDLYKNLRLFSEFGYWKGGVMTFVGGGGSDNLSPYFSVATGGLGLKF